MKKISIYGFGLLAALYCTAATAQTLTTDQIVALSSTGIGDEAIIAKIRTTQTHIDLTTDQMIQLKQQGVSGPVIAAILSGGAQGGGNQILSTTSLDPAVLHPAGVYLADQASGKAMRIDPVMSNQAKTGGIWGYALTGGIASMSIKISIQNETARVHGQGPRPSFLFFFDASLPEAGRSGTWASGTAATTTSPSEFSLVRLTKKDGRREARVGSLNIGGAKTGVMDKDRIPFDYQLVREGVYRVTPQADLSPGEYGFVVSLTGAATAGAMTARIFDFSV